MKERPIIFSGEMVKTILDGRKTQTRRVIKKICIHSIKTLADGVVLWRSGPAGKFHRGFPGDDLRKSCPCGQPGDRLWVREAWRSDNSFKGGGIPRLGIRYGEGVTWREGNPDQTGQIGRAHV